jgi:hypothetical protein
MFVISELASDPGSFDPVKTACPGANVLPPRRAFPLKTSVPESEPIARGVPALPALVRMLGTART